MTWMKTYYNWLLRKLLIKKLSFTCSNKEQNSSLTHLCTLRNPYEYLNATKILVVWFIYCRMHSSDKIHLLGCSTDLLFQCPASCCCPETCFKNSFKALCPSMERTSQKSVKLWNFQICRDCTADAKASFLKSNQSSNFPTPPHPFRGFLITVFSRRKLWRVVILIPWGWVSGNGYFINYR